MRKHFQYEQLATSTFCKATFDKTTYQTEWHSHIGHLIFEFWCRLCQNNIFGCSENSVFSVATIWLYIFINSHRDHRGL